MLIPLLFLQVLMKDIVTPVPPEEVKGVIRKCLEQAAQLNYQRIKDYAKVEGKCRSTMTADVRNTHSVSQLRSHSALWNSNVFQILLSYFSLRLITIATHHSVMGWMVNLCPRRRSVVRVCRSPRVTRSNNSLLCFRPALALCCSVGQLGFCVEVCE